MASFFLIVTFFVLATRAWIWVNYLLLSKTPRIATSAAPDAIRFHHYDLGAVLVALSVVLALGGRQLAWSAPLVAGLGMGMVLEEWTVLVESLGVPPPTRYFSGPDVLLVLGAWAAVYGCLYLVALRDGGPPYRPQR